MNMAEKYINSVVRQAKQSEIDRLQKELLLSSPPGPIPDANDELLRKSKQLSRLTAERFARIEDRLDKLEEDK